jgi:hypothetical protein
MPGAGSLEAHWPARSRPSANAGRGEDHPVRATAVGHLARRIFGGGNAIVLGCACRMDDRQARLIADRLARQPHTARFVWLVITNPGRLRAVRPRMQRGCGARRAAARRASFRPDRTTAREACHAPRVSCQEICTSVSGSRVAPIVLTSQSIVSLAKRTHPWLRADPSGSIRLAPPRRGFQLFLRRRRTVAARRCGPSIRASAADELVRMPRYCPHNGKQADRSRRAGFLDDDAHRTNGRSGSKQGERAAGYRNFDAPPIAPRRVLPGNS